jgi:type I restriction enzyme M protein
VPKVIKESAFEGATIENVGGGARRRQMADALSGSRHATVAKDVCLGLPFLNYTFDWGAERPKSNKCCQHGAPAASNANFARVQHFIHHLTSHGVAGFVLANGSMSSNQFVEGDVRRAAHLNPWHN